MRGTACLTERVVPIDLVDMQTCAVQLIQVKANATVIILGK